MAYWLVKTDPESYTFADLEREGTTAWTGVRNARAQANLRAMSEGDVVIVYHSGEKRAVGVSQVVRAAYPELEAAAGEPDGEADPRGLVCVDLRAVGLLPAPVPLGALKLEPAFAHSALVRAGRLSVVPLSPAEWKNLLQLSDVIAKTGGLAHEERF